MEDVDKQNVVMDKRVAKPYFTCFILDMEKFLIDTNIFVRVITQDHKGLFLQATNFFDDCKAQKYIGCIDIQVISEVLYVCTSSIYGISKDIVVKALKFILLTYDIHMENDIVVYQSLDMYIKSRLDWVDCYLICQVKYGRYDGIISFDKKLNRNLRG